MRVVTSPGQPNEFWQHKAGRTRDGGIIRLYLPQHICAVKVFLLSCWEEEEWRCIIEHSRKNEAPCQKSLTANVV